jgi:hypothetical protein
MPEQLVDVGRARQQRLAAPEREQPPGEIGAALGGGAHRLGERPQRVALDLVRQHVGIEQDRGQHVVEVVRNAAGELADRFHALGMRELRLGMFLVSDVG